LSRKFGKTYKRNVKNSNDANQKAEKIRQILADEKQITAALQRAVREAVQVHRRAGNPIAAWKDGKAVLIETK